jgi:hypothetical protein
MQRSVAWLLVVAALSTPAAAQSAGCGHAEVQVTGAENRQYGAEFAVFSQYRVRRWPRDRFAIEMRTPLAHDSLLTLFVQRSDSAPEVGRTYPIGSDGAARSFSGFFVRSPQARRGHLPEQFVTYTASRGDVAIDSTTRDGSLAGHGRFTATGPRGRDSSRPRVDVQFSFLAAPETRQCHLAMVRNGLVQSPGTTP